MASMRSRRQKQSLIGVKAMEESKKRRPHAPGATFDSEPETWRPQSPPKGTKITKLVSCHACEAAISITAFDCPQCGAFLKNLERSEFGKFVKWSFIIFNVLMGFWVFTVLDINETTTVLDVIAIGIGLYILLGTWLTGYIVLALAVLMTRPSK